MSKTNIKLYRSLVTAFVLCMSFATIYGQRLVQQSGRGVVAVKRNGTNRSGDGGSGAITLTGTPTFIPEIPKAGYKWDYSDLASSGIIRIVADPDAVSIEDVKSPPSKYVIYDASGRRVSGISRHGTYIVNGVKMNY
mgnify:CR=1 FL=1